MILPPITAVCAWDCLLLHWHWPPPTSQTGARIAFAIARSAREHVLAASPSIRSPCRPGRMGGGNQTRKQLRWKMPLPDSSPSPGEAKVFSSPSSPSYGRKEGAAAARGMPYIKRASVPPTAIPPTAMPQDFNVAIPRHGSQEAAPAAGPIAASCSPGCSPAPRRVPRPGSPGPQRGWQPPGVPAGPRFAPPQGHRPAAGPGPGLAAGTRGKPEAPPGGGTLFLRLCPPWFGVLRCFAGSAGSAQSQPYALHVERDAGGMWGRNRRDVGGMWGEGVNRVDTAPLEPSSCGYLIKPCFGAAFSLT